MKFANLDGAAHGADEDHLRSEWHARHPGASRRRRDADFAIVNPR
jgi:hypothetical protein